MAALAAVAAILSLASTAVAQSAPRNQFRISLLAESYTQHGIIDTLSKAWSPYDSRDSVAIVIDGPRGSHHDKYNYIGSVELKVGLLRWTDTTHEVPDPDAIAAHAIWIPSKQTFFAVDSGQAEHLVLGVLHPATIGTNLRKLRQNLVVVGIRIDVARVTSTPASRDLRPAMVVQRAIYIASLD